MLSIQCIVLNQINIVIYLIHFVLIIHRLISLIHYLDGLLTIDIIPEDYKRPAMYIYSLFFLALVHVFNSIEQTVQVAGIHVVLHIIHVHKIVPMMILKGLAFSMIMSLLKIALNNSIGSNNS